MSNPSVWRRQLKPLGHSSKQQSQSRSQGGGRLRSHSFHSAMASEMRYSSRPKAVATSEAGMAGELRGSDGACAINLSLSLAPSMLPSPRTPRRGSTDAPAWSKRCSASALKMRLPPPPEAASAPSPRRAGRSAMQQGRSGGQRAHSAASHPTREAPREARRPRGRAAWRGAD
eukprot:scaffold39152_cov40-Tisochrysis_lutea.AAC.1